MGRQLLVEIIDGPWIDGVIPTVSYNTAYSTTLTARNARLPVRWSIVGDALPSGLSINATTGEISGTTTEAGSHTVTVGLRDGAGDFTSRTFQFRVVALGLSLGSSLDDMTVGAAFSDTLPITGGVGPHEVIAYTLPAGVSASVVGVNVSVTGTPTTENAAFNWSITVEDDEGATATASGTVEVAAYVDPYTTITELHFEGTEGAFGPGAYTDDAPSPLTWGAANSNGLIAAAAVYEGTRGLNLGTSRIISQPSLAGTGDSGFNFGSDDFTIEVSTYFATIPGAGNHRLLLAKDDVSTTRGWLLILSGDAGGKLQFSFNSSGTWSSLESPSALSATTWYRVKIERLGNDLNMYIDSGGGYSLVDTADVTGKSVNSTSHPVVMGVLKNGGSILGNTYHNGYMDYLLVRRKYP